MCRTGKDESLILWFRRLLVDVNKKPNCYDFEIKIKHIFRKSLDSPASLRALTTPSSFSAVVNM